MQKFNEIISVLNISSIIIVENDLKAEESIEVIFAKYLILSSNNKKYLLADLRNKDFNELVNLLEKSDISFNKISHTEKKITYLSIGELCAYLKTIDSAETSELLLLYREIEAEFIKNDVLKYIFFKYGITQGDTTYNNLINQIINDDEYKPCILLYQDIVSSDIEDLENCLLKISESSSLSFMAIVDKMLGNGEPNGIKVINEHIRSISDKNKLNAYTFLLTSNVTNDPEILDDYDLLVVSKQSDSLIADICKILSINAYSKVFKYFEKLTLDSLSQVSNVVSKNKNNIAHIIEKASKEGMLPYEAIRIWYENALNLFTNRIDDFWEKQIFISTIGLAKLFNKETFAENTELTDEFKTYLSDISTNEVFDYSINSKHLPIAPGDVFSLSNDYWVVIGQTCDVTLRQDLTRSSKLAILVKATFEIPSNKNQNVKTDRKSSEYLKFNSFKNNDGAMGFLKIEPKTSTTNYVDFMVLDTCMYNKDGACTIDIRESLSNDLINYFPESSMKYYKKIQENIVQLKDIEEQVKIIIKNKVNGLLEYEFNMDRITFPYKRICRIKGNFNHLIHHNYWHYRSRTDLNEISLIEK